MSFPLRNSDPYGAAPYGATSSAMFSPNLPAWSNTEKGNSPNSEDADESMNESKIVETGQILEDEFSDGEPPTFPSPLSYPSLGTATDIDEIPDSSIKMRLNRQRPSGVGGRLHSFVVDGDRCVAHYDGSVGNFTRTNNLFKVEYVHQTLPPWVASQESCVAWLTFPGVSASHSSALGESPTIAVVLKNGFLDVRECATQLNLHSGPPVDREVVKAFDRGGTETVTVRARCYVLHVPTAPTRSWHEHCTSMPFYVVNTAEKKGKAKPQSGSDIWGSNRGQGPDPTAQQLSPQDSATPVLSPLSALSLFGSPSPVSPSSGETGSSPEPEEPMSFRAAHTRVLADESRWVSEDAKSPPSYVILVFCVTGFTSDEFSGYPFDLHISFRSWLKNHPRVESEYLACPVHLTLLQQYRVTFYVPSTMLPDLHVLQRTIPTWTLRIPGRSDKWNATVDLSTIKGFHIPSAKLSRTKPRSRQNVPRSLSIGAGVPNQRSSVGSLPSPVSLSSPVGSFPSPVASLSSPVGSPSSQASAASTASAASAVYVALNSFLSSVSQMDRPPDAVSNRFISQPDASQFVPQFQSPLQMPNLPTGRGEKRKKKPRHRHSEELQPAYASAMLSLPSFTHLPALPPLPGPLGSSPVSPSSIQFAFPIGTPILPTTYGAFAAPPSTMQPTTLIRDPRARSEAPSRTVPATLPGMSRIDSEGIIKQDEVFRAFSLPGMRRRKSASDIQFGKRRKSFGKLVSQIHQNLPLLEVVQGERSDAEEKNVQNSAPVGEGRAVVHTGEGREQLHQFKPDWTSSYSAQDAELVVLLNRALGVAGGLDKFIFGTRAVANGWHVDASGFADLEIAIRLDSMLEESARRLETLSKHPDLALRQQWSVLDGHAHFIAQAVKFLIAAQRWADLDEKSRNEDHPLNYQLRDAHQRLEQAMRSRVDGDGLPRFNEDSIHSFLYSDPFQAIDSLRKSRAGRSGEFPPRTVAPSPSLLSTPPQVPPVDGYCRFEDCCFLALCGCVVWCCDRVKRRPVHVYQARCAYCCCCGWLPCGREVIVAKDPQHQPQQVDQLGAALERLRSAPLVTVPQDMKMDDEGAQGPPLQPLQQLQLQQQPSQRFEEGIDLPSLNLQELARVLASVTDEPTHRVINSPSGLPVTDRPTDSIPSQFAPPLLANGSIVRILAVQGDWFRHKEGWSRLQQGSLSFVESMSNQGAPLGSAGGAGVSASVLRPSAPPQMRLPEAELAAVDHALLF